jgi:hypothetical protein
MSGKWPEDYNMNSHHPNSSAPADKQYHVTFEDNEDTWGSYDTIGEAIEAAQELLKEIEYGTTINIERMGYVLGSLVVDYKEEWGKIIK